MTPTSTAQLPPNVQAVSLSFVNGHGVLVVQNWTALTWPAVAGASVGTSWMVPVEGVGLALAELDGWADGVVWTWPTGLWPRPARTMTPTIPRSNTIATATAAGTSQGGRSERTPREDAGRGTYGLRTGVLGGGAVCVAAEPGAAKGSGADDDPMPGGTTSPGFQTGAPTVLQGVALGAGAAGEGGLVAIAGAGGGTLSNDGNVGLGGSGCGSGTGGAGAAGAGGLVTSGGEVVSKGIDCLAGGSDHVGTDGALGIGGGGAGGADEAAAGAVGTGGNVTAGIEGYVCTERSGASLETGLRAGVSSRLDGAT